MSAKRILYVGTTGPSGMPRHRSLHGRRVHGARPRPRRRARQNQTRPRLSRSSRENSPIQWRSRARSTDARASSPRRARGPSAPGANRREASEPCARGRGRENRAAHLGIRGERNPRLRRVRPGSRKTRRRGGDRIIRVAVYHPPADVVHGDASGIRPRQSGDGDRRHPPALALARRGRFRPDRGTSP